MGNITITANRELLLDGAQALRNQGRDIAGMSQAPELITAEDTLEWAQANMLEAIIAEASLPQGRHYGERADVLAFQQKFSVPMAKEPTWLPPELQAFREKFLHEELNEFITAYSEKDMHGAADALVDLAYVLHGTALMMGLPWPMLWDEVQRKNMQKMRAKSAEQSKRGSSFDVIKPEGWTPPDHTAALGVGPWKTLKVEA